MVVLSGLLPFAVFVCDKGGFFSPSLPPKPTRFKKILQAFETFEINYPFGLLLSIYDTKCQISYRNASCIPE
jgi:hypothetical protein